MLEPEDVTENIQGEMTNDDYGPSKNISIQILQYKKQNKMSKNHEYHLKESDLQATLLQSE